MLTRFGPFGKATDTIRRVSCDLSAEMVCW